MISRLTSRAIHGPQRFRSVRFPLAGWRSASQSSAYPDQPANGCPPPRAWPATVAAVRLAARGKRRGIGASRGQWAVRARSGANENLRGGAGAAAGGCEERPVLLADVDTLLFDCDGVLWRGETAVPGAPETLRALRARGKRLGFITNNSSKTRTAYAEKLRRLGFGGPAGPDAGLEVFGTAYCSALYLRQRLAGVPDPKAYVLGSPALAAELEAVGVSSVGVGPEALQGESPSDWLAVPLDPDVRAVVVGFDPHFSYMKLTKAVRYLQQPDCLLVGTNMDNRLPLENGRFIAGTGCLVRAVEMAAQRQADIIGKPSRFIFDCVSQEYGINPERTVMVGDRLDTDILLGATCSLKTILTLTGVSTLEDVKINQESDCMNKKKMVPDFYVDSIADLLPALQG
uniref:glycerol-3-phosphate phosphatase n=1 Tax=Myodes glareolus TaxID=447135 RepID=UPI002020AE4B|nr:glycerol-3-phosphate phosphatase [Myodes glareolus]